MSNNRKVVIRTLQAETGWSYQACRNLLEKHAGDLPAALYAARSMGIAIK